MLLWTRGYAYLSNFVGKERRVLIGTEYTAKRPVEDVPELIAHASAFIAPLVHKRVQAGRAALVVFALCFVEHALDPQQPCECMSIRRSISRFNFSSQLVNDGTRAPAFLHRGVNQV